MDAIPQTRFPWCGTGIPSPSGASGYQTGRCDPAPVPLGRQFSLEGKESQLRLLNQKPMIIAVSVHLTLWRRKSVTMTILIITSCRRPASISMTTTKTAAGIYTACMAGSWMCIVNGFTGMRTYGGSLRFNTLPEKWARYAFKVKFRAGNWKSVSGSYSLPTIGGRRNGDLSQRHPANHRLGLPFPEQCVKTPYTIVSLNYLAFYDTGSLESLCRDIPATAGWTGFNWRVQRNWTALGLPHPPLGLSQ